LYLHFFDRWNAAITGRWAIVFLLFVWSAIEAAATDEFDGRCDIHLFNMNMGKNIKNRYRSAGYSWVS
jgi:hypothetical protein